MIACCGLDCSKCECFLATQTDDDNMRADIAKKWSARYRADIKPEHINCEGCRSDGRKFFYCADMCELRKCCQEMELDNCAACDMYSTCDKLKHFCKIAPEAREALDKLRS
ncbi:MAG: DUF3795 domain-containing protein [Desulfobacteraceae bacterium]|nr:DUF3795 domain-containing protein [Desulfobacteraceae bacterium]MBC2756362.1 DUF3795 domain-containing protein [Desulfobacteraceae bacterium]